MKCNAKLHPDYFSVKVSATAVVFRQEILKTDSFAWNCRFFEICWQNTTASTETFTKNN